MRQARKRQHRLATHAAESERLFIGGPAKMPPCISAPTKSEYYRTQRQTLAFSTEIEDIVELGTATHRLCWCVIFWIMLMYGFRADTIGGMQSADDLRVETDLSINFMVRRVKRQNVASSGVLKPFLRKLPAPRTASSIRGRVHSIIKAAAELRDSENKQLLMSLIEKPS